MVKGAKVTQEAYQLKAPRPAERASPRPDAHREDPRFLDMHAAAGAAEAPPVEVPQVDLAALAAEAAKIVDDASASAQALVHEGEQRALTLIEEAQSRVSAIEDAAKREGFDQGVGDGRAAAQAEMDEMLETMRGLIEMARIERHKIIEGAEAEIVRLAVTIAERVLNAHVSVENNAVLEMTRAAITRLVNRETVTVRVNPSDIELMRGNREQLMSMNDIDNLRIIEDQRVDRGGVIIETDAGNIDAKISTQLREVRRLLAVDDTLAVAPSAEPVLLNPPAQAS